MPNLPRTPEQKAEQRQAARNKRAGIQFRFSDARSVACQQMGLRYKPVDAPRTHSDLVTATMHPGEIKTPAQKTKMLFMPKSWEIMTERLTG